MTKKIWTPPTVEVLDIDVTLGGSVPFFDESQVSSINTRGSYPVGVNG